MRIVELLAGEHAYESTSAGLDAVRARFEDGERAGRAVNARDARTLFEQMIERQASRLTALEVPTRDQLIELTVDDLP